MSPVSYTHLDVYKRQLQGRRGAEITTAGWLSAVCPSRACLCTCTLMDRFTFCCVYTPSSATHSPLLTDLTRMRRLKIIPSEPTFFVRILAIAVVLGLHFCYIFSAVRGVSVQKKIFLQIGFFGMRLDKTRLVLLSLSLIHI